MRKHAWVRIPPPPHILYILLRRIHKIYRLDEKFTLSERSESNGNLTVSAFARRSELRRTKSAYVDREGEIHPNKKEEFAIDRQSLGEVGYTYTNKYTAFNFEKYLKSGSGRAFLKKHEIITQ